MGIPDKLKILRKSSKLTQNQVAANLNITRATYGHYETGHADPPAAMLSKLAKFYSVSVDYILSDESDNIPTLSTNTSEFDLSSEATSSTHQKALHIKAAIMNIVGLAFDGEPEDEETLKLVMKALEEGAALAKEESKKRYSIKTDSSSCK